MRRSWTSQYQTWFIFAVCLLILNTFGTPVFAFLFLLKHRKEIESDLKHNDFIRSWGPLFEVRFSG